jgi:hypothetical protein
MEVRDEIDARIEGLEKELAAKNLELEIEAALEKVRSRSLAMHKSDELKEVIVVVLEKLQELNVTMLDRSAIIIEFEEGSKDIIQWVASPQHTFPLRLRTPYFDTVIFSDFWDAKGKGIKFYTKSYSVDQKNSFFKYFFDHYGQTVPDEEKKWILSCKHYDVSVAIEKKSATIIANHSSNLVSEEGNEILKRFARIFDQAYIRFLDLQKAEAQAREAQIQLALERVRARTMAMQKSDELMEAANLLFQQVQSLGIPVWTCGYNIWETGEKSCIGWMSTRGAIQPSFRIPLTENLSFMHMYESRLRGESFFAEEVSGEALADHYRYMFSLPDFKKIATEQLKDGFTLPPSQVHNVFNFKHGNLIFISAEPIPEAWDIFKRFAQVFEQTYTRFLDLQKVEAQAREAQIEAAMEKIRSRSLAMQQSGELKDVVAVLFEKLKELGLVFDGGAAIHLFSENSRDAVIWVVTSELPAPICVNRPYDETAFLNNPIILDVWKAKDTGEHLLNKTYSFEDKNKYFNYVFKYNDETIIPQPVRQFILNADSYTATFIAEKNSLLGANSWSGQLFTQDDIDILKRFARVFEQAYIRFLDMKKAEAQAREAQIEAALEKVRARAMAMQKSEELTELVATVFNELTRLDFNLTRCFIYIIDEKSSSYRIWMLNVEDQKTPVSFYVQFFDQPYIHAFVNAWKERKNQVGILFER